MKKRVALIIEFLVPVPGFQSMRLFHSDLKRLQMRVSVLVHWFCDSSCRFFQLGVLLDQMVWLSAKTQLSTQRWVPGIWYLEQDVCLGIYLWGVSVKDIT